MVYLKLDLKVWRKKSYMKLEIVQSGIFQNVNALRCCSPRWSTCYRTRSTNSSLTVSVELREVTYIPLNCLSKTSEWTFQVVLALTASSVSRGSSCSCVQTQANEPVRVHSESVGALAKEKKILSAAHIHTSKPVLRVQPELAP
jgi:hypothetical protein